MAMPANYYAPSNAYWLSGDFVGRDDGARLWSSAPVSATITVSDAVDIGTLSLAQSMPLGAQDGAFASQSDSTYTLYLCSADTRPHTLYMPFLANFLPLL